MLQSILVLLLFLAACFFLGRMAWQNFFAAKGPCDGCAIAKLHREALHQRK